MLLFTGCGDDDDKDEPANYNSLLWGTWVYEEAVDDSAGMVTMESVWVFRKNGTCTWTIQAKVNGNTQESESIDADYLYDGKYLYINDGEDEDKTLVTVNGNTMIMYIDDDLALVHHRQ